MSLALSGVASGAACQEPLPRDSTWVGERVRYYTAFAPDSLARSPMLLLVFHGSNGDPAVARAMTGLGFEGLAQSSGDIVAYPAGWEGNWNDCRGAATHSANLNDLDDVRFVRQLVDQLAETHNLDFSRVVAVGYSGGGQLAYRLALEAPDLVQSVASAMANLPAESNLDCQPVGSPISVLTIVGTDDDRNPYLGGPSGLGGRFGEVRSAAATFDYWAELAGLVEAPSEETLPDVSAEDGSTIRVRSVRGPGFEVTLTSVVGGGHTVPSRFLQWPPALGPMNRDVEGVDLIWDFFARVTPEEGRQ